jgi:hypothetical protein
MPIVRSWRRTFKPAQSIRQTDEIPATGHERASWWCSGCSTQCYADPVPFDAEAARVYGRVTAAVVAAGRKPRRRIADLMIVATAVAEGLLLYTTNPGDYTGLEKLVRVVPVTRLPLPHEKKSDSR